MGAQFGRMASGGAPTPSPSPTPTPASTLIDTTTGLAAFSAAPWGTNNLTLGSAGAPGPTGSGDATLLTSTGTYDLLYRPDLGPRLLKARVKAGTTDIFTLYMNTATGSFPRTNFNLTTGTFAEFDLLTGSAMTSLGGGWWLVEAQGTCNNFLGCGPDVNGAGGVNALLFDFSVYSVP